MHNGLVPMLKIALFYTGLVCAETTLSLPVFLEKSMVGRPRRMSASGQPSTVHLATASHNAWLCC